MIIVRGFVYVCACMSVLRSDALAQCDSADNMLQLFVIRWFNGKKATSTQMILSGSGF